MSWPPGYNLLSENVKITLERTIDSTLKWKELKSAIKYFDLAPSLRFESLGVNVNYAGR